MKVYILLLSALGFICIDATASNYNEQINSRKNVDGGESSKKDYSTSGDRYQTMQITDESIEAEEVTRKVFLKSYNGFKKYNHPNRGDGLYSFYFHIGDNEREEKRQQDGEVTGKYAYIAPKGQEFEFHYGADNHGYRVASPALPSIPKDTPDVKQAKEKFFAVYEKILNEFGKDEVHYNTIDQNVNPSEAIPINQEGVATADHFHYNTIGHKANPSEVKPISQNGAAATGHPFHYNTFDHTANPSYEIPINQDVKAATGHHGISKSTYNSKSIKYEEDSSEESSEESSESEENNKRAVGYYNQHLGVRFNPYG